MTNKSEKKVLKCLYIVFIIYFLFNVGFIFEITKDHPRSISLSQNSVGSFGDVEDIGIFYTTFMPEQDVFSAKWLGVNMNKSVIIHATCGHGQGKAALHSYGNVPTENISMLEINAHKIKKNNYVYLMYVNVVENIALGTMPELGYPTYFGMSEVYLILQDRNKIYTNGGSLVMK